VISFKIIAIVGALAMVAFAGYRSTRRHSGSTRKIVSVALVLLFFLGLGLIFVEGQTIDRFIQIREWPTAEAKIVSTEVAGTRAFHPVIGYEYWVDGTKYLGETDMGMPGFGSKAYRKSNSERIISDYPPGTRVPVHYDPENPSQSMIHTAVHYSTYLLITIGTLFYGSGLFGIMQIFVKWFRRDRKEGL